MLYNSRHKVAVHNTAYNNTHKFNCLKNISSRQFNKLCYTILRY